MTIKMFYAFLMVLFFTTFPMGMLGTVFAQDQPPGEEHQPPSADDIVSKMQSKLSLTQDQVTAITPIIEKYATKREELRQSMEDGTADKDSMRSQMKQLREDEKQELGQVLSEDQLSQWEQMQAQGRHRHNEGQAQRSGAEGTGPTGDGTNGESGNNESGSNDGRSSG